MGMASIGRHMTGFARARAGVAAVEFAIVAPLYLFLLVGMVAYGIYFGASHSVQQISADAARASVAGLTAEERRLLASRFIALNAGGYAFIDPAKLTVSVGDSAADTGQFDVVVSYDAAELPIWSLFRGLSMPNQTISRRATIRIGGI